MVIKLEEKHSQIRFVTNFRKEETMRMLFFDEKNFDNLLNEGVWAPCHSTANGKGGIVEKRKFPQKVMVWLGVCSMGISTLVIFVEGTLNHI